MPGLAGGITYVDGLEGAGNVDTFQINLSAGVRYFLDVGSDAIPDLHLTLKNSAQQTLYSGNIGYGRADFYTPDQNETLFLTVRSASLASTGAYSLYYQATLTANLPLRLGSSGDDRLTAQGASELWGWDGNDALVGSSAADCLVGGRGNDTLAGGAGADRMIGGVGNDTYMVDNAGDRVQESAGAGLDLVRSSVSHALAANLERMTLTGAAPINGTGNALANVLAGNAAANALNGGAGDDQLFGGAGSDRLTGGLGADVFLFAQGSSGRGAARDVVLDFARGIDRLDLRAIDADTLHAGNQAFDFVGALGFSGAAGQLRFQGGILSGDLNGDRAADFEIALPGVASLAATDILL